MQAALQLAVNDERPIIPTLLPGCHKQPKLPIFLGTRTWVDLRNGYTQAGIDRPVWGITGKKPDGQIAQDEPINPRRSACIRGS